MEIKTAKVTIGYRNYRTTVLVGGHEVIADEPLELGGGNEGPTATHFLLASLGACTAATMRMYAERKEWTLGDISIGLSLEQHNESGKMHSKISKEITFGEALTPDQYKRMMVIADKCPIHKTLMGEMSIETT